MIRALLVGSTLAVGALGAVAILQREDPAQTESSFAFAEAQDAALDGQAPSSRLLQETIYDARGIYSAVAMDALDYPEEPADAPPGSAPTS
jgi:hypothetical protein